MTSLDQARAAQLDRPATRPLASFLPWLIFLAFLVLPFPAAMGAESYILGTALRVMIFAIAAVSLDLLVGYGALISFGHAAFIGIGGYAVGILASHGLGDAVIALPAALLASGLFAFLSGFICLRTKGAYFIMITLAFGQMVYFIAGSLAPYGGDDGLTIQARSTFLGLDLLADDRSLYYVALVCLTGVFLLCRSLVASRFGRVLRGSKENAQRMATLGYDVFRYQLCAYVIAGMIAGLAGFLLANATNFVSPSYMSWQRSGELLIMIILGGTGRLSGALLGAIVFMLLEVFLADITEDWKLIFGPLLVLAVLFLPGGIMGFLERQKRRGGHD